MMGNGDLVTRPAYYGTIKKGKGEQQHIKQGQQFIEPRHLVKISQPAGTNI